MKSAKKYVLVDPNDYEAGPSQFDTEIRSILYSDEPDDVKAKQYSLALNRYKSHKTPTVNDDHLEGDVLDSVPYQSRHKAKRLLRLLRENPEVDWNENGELAYRQTTVPRSHIADLVSDALKSKQGQTEPPVGWLDFARGLASSEAPKDLVPNPRSWKAVLQQRAPVESPYKRATPSSNRKRISWEHY